MNRKGLFKTVPVFRVTYKSGKLTRVRHAAAISVPKMRCESNTRILPGLWRDNAEGRKSGQTVDKRIEPTGRPYRQETSVGVTVAIHPETAKASNAVKEIEREIN